MSAPTVTEREAVLRERKAFVTGWLEGCKANGMPAAHSADQCKEWAYREACVRHPLPTVTRPRVVRDKRGFDFRVIGKRVECRLPAGWRDVAEPGVVVCLTAERAQLVTDLLANPTEEVSDCGMPGCRDTAGCHDCVDGAA